MATSAAGGKPAAALVDVKHEDQGAEGKSNEATGNLNKNSPQYSTNTQHNGNTRPSILAKASSTGPKSLNEGKLNYLATANMVKGGRATATLDMDRAEPKTRRVVTSENKSKAHGQEGGEVNTAVLEAMAPLARLGVSGQEVGLAQPKAHGTGTETTVSVPAKDMKRMADWRAMGNQLRKWLRNRMELKRGETPPARKNNVQPQAMAPVVPKGMDKKDVQGAKHMEASSHGGGPGQTRYDYSDKRWLEGRWREE